MNKALIVTAFAKFVKSFLTNDILILQSKGYEVHVAANLNHVGAECMPEYFKEHNVIFHQVDFSSNKPISLETVKSYIQMKRILKTVKFDFVHVHTPISGLICRVACNNYRKKGLRVAYTTHGFYFHKGSSKKSWLIYRTVEDWMSRYSDAIITINSEDFENAKRMRCKKVYQIPGVGVDILKFRNINIDRTKYREGLNINENQILVLAVGELSERKNHRVIIEALSKCTNIKNIVLMICGNAMTSENTAEELKTLAKKMNVDLRLMGLRDDIPEICKCADIGVMPSTREGLGLSGIEMIASGLPLVASGVHGILDYMKDGINGFTADPHNADDFAEKITYLLDPELRNKISKTCSESVEKFDKHYSYTNISNIYADILV